MKRYIIFLLVFVIPVMPKNADSEVEEYKVVSELPKEKITLFAKKNMFQYSHRIITRSFAKKECRIKKIKKELIHYNGSAPF
jgi:hypothetical protein